MKKLTVPVFFYFYIVSLIFIEVSSKNMGKSWEFHLLRNFKLVFIEMSNENLQENEIINTFQRPIPEINRLKFPKYVLILPFYRG